MNVKSVPIVSPFSLSVWAQFTIEVVNRDKIQSGLSEKGIPTAVHYPTPLNKQPAVMDLNVSIPVSDEASKHVISLPMGPYLAEDEQRTVIRELKGIVGSF